MKNHKNYPWKDLEYILRDPKNYKRCFPVSRNTSYEEITMLSVSLALRCSKSKINNVINNDKHQRLKNKAIRAYKNRLKTIKLYSFYDIIGNLGKEDFDYKRPRFYYTLMKNMK